MPPTETTLGIDWVRAQFPSLREPGSPIFLDNPGGTQVPDCVIDAVTNYYRTSNANVGGHFSTSARTVEIIKKTRDAVAALLNAPDSDTIIFGNNMTSLTFALARSIGDTIKPGDEIIVTDLDHDANVSPWLDLRKQGAVVKTARMNVADCTLDVDAISELLSERTRVVAITAASNAVGTIPDIASIIREAHKHGALVFVDAVQYVPHRLTDVVALGCDFLACSSYKFFGPHAGILYGKRECLEKFAPHKVKPAPNQIPQCWETGTQNHEGIAGVGAAIEYLASVGSSGNSFNGTLRSRLEESMRVIEAWESELCNVLITGLLAIPGITIYGITDPDRMKERLCTVAFTWDKFSPEEIARSLGTGQVNCWNGNYYAINLMESLGIQDTGGAVRIGPAHYNTLEEINLLIFELREMYRTLR